MDRSKQKKKFCFTHHRQVVRHCFTPSTLMQLNPVVGAADGATVGPDDRRLEQGHAIGAVGGGDGDDEGCSADALLDEYTEGLLNAVTEQTSIFLVLAAFAAPCCGGSGGAGAGTAGARAADRKLHGALLLLLCVRVACSRVVRARVCASLMILCVRVACGRAVPARVCASLMLLCVRVACGRAVRARACVCVSATRRHPCILVRVVEGATRHLFFFRARGATSVCVDPRFFFFFASARTGGAAERCVTISRSGARPPFNVARSARRARGGPRTGDRDDHARRPFRDRGALLPHGRL